MNIQSLNQGFSRTDAMYILWKSVYHNPVWCLTENTKTVMDTKTDNMILLKTGYFDFFPFCYND